MKSAAVYLSAFAILLFSFPASAQWPENGSPACAAPYDKVNPKIAGDGLGNAFLTWSEWPPVLDSPHHRIQKVDAGGVLWSDCGVLACTVNIHGFYPSIAADGAGGAIAVWVDSRGIGWPIYAQRIDADGSLLWASEAVQACGPEGYKWWPRLCSDGSGGAIIVWSDDRNGGWDVYAQRIDAAGTVIWPQDGVALCSADDDQGEAYLVPDGAGGAIVMWTDARGDEYDIFAQRIDANGTILWAADGIPVCSASGPQIMACMVSDGAGGAIIAWDDGRTQVPADDIFAQRIAGNGSLLWPAEGVGVCVAPSTQNGCRIASDGAGGAIVIWMDNRSPGQGIYAQRIDANGALQWPAAGTPITAADGWQRFPSIAADGFSGAVVAWEDDRNGDWDVYAQRITANGRVLWETGGTPVCTADSTQRYVEIASDGEGGAFVAWRDERNGRKDIYVQYLPGGAAPLHVNFDIRPGSCPNPLNPKSEGVLPAAVLGTSDMNVYEIDPATIELEGISALRWSYEDVAAPVDDGSECACTDARPDGYLDLTLKFDVSALVEKLGTLEPGQMLTLALSGALLDGTPIEGSDCVRIVGGLRKERMNLEILSIAVPSQPNSPRQRIEYALSKPSVVEISMYDVAGRLVKRFDCGIEQAGTHIIEWDVAPLASGVYFCRVSAGAEAITKKIVLLK